MLFAALLLPRYLFRLARFFFRKFFRTFIVLFLTVGALGDSYREVAEFQKGFWPLES
jgi:hypothetical protein